MKHSNKKCFTIVELVIVIAVIAILAAVLIPTFSSLVKKANMSADQQAVSNMNKILATETKATTVDEVVEILIANNYTNDLTTYYSNYTLGWIASENVIVLVENNQIAYPTAYVDKGFSFELIKPMATDADSLTNGLVDGSVVYVNENITIGQLYLDTKSGYKAGTYTVNLNGKKLTTDDLRVLASAVDFDEGETIVLDISNGIIECNPNPDAIVYSAVEARHNATVKLTNVQVFANGISATQANGGTLILENVTAVNSGEAEEDWWNAAIEVNNRIDSAGTILSHANVTVESGMYNGKYAIQMSSPGGTVVINGGTFVGNTAVINADYDADYASQGARHSITINGGNFTGAINIAEGVTCVVNGGTFNVDIGKVANVKIGDGKTVVDNGNGTWTVQ